MSLLPDSVINGLKSLADKAGWANQGPRTIFELLDPQNKNVFQMVVYPSDLTNISFSQVGTILADNAISTLYVRSLNIPFIGFEYATHNQFKFMENILYPEEVAITFIEDEIGVVRKYLNSWFNEIVVPDPINYGSYRFRENQLASKKDAIILPQTGLGIPTIGKGWIKISGMKFKGISEITFGHEENEPLRIDAQFSVDKVWWS